MDFFTTERNDGFSDPMFRYVSLFNGSRGTWCYTKELAIEQGNRHKELVLFLHGKVLPKEEG